MSDLDSSKFPNECKSCGGYFAPGFYYQHRRLCKDCYNRQRRIKANTPPNERHMTKEEARSRRDGGKTRCKVCEEWKDAATQFYKKTAFTCKACRNSHIIEHRRNSGTDFAYYLWAKYRIREAEFTERLTAQEGRCALCERELKPRATAVDHCHTTNRVRGILCYACNAALGMFKDDPSLLRKAARYVENLGGSLEKGGG